MNMAIKPFGLRHAPGRNALNVEPSSHLSRFPIRAADGRTLGDLYGVLVLGYHGAPLRIVDGAIELSGEVGSCDDVAEALIGGLHGSYVIHTHTALPDRLYPDAGGTLPIVYCAATQRLGSSASMLFDDAEYAARFDADLHDKVVANDITGSWITGFLTAHTGLLRLLPNFYLDLKTWSAQRCWPHPETFAFDMTIDRATPLVGDAMSAFTTAAARQFKVGVSTTAGFDTRALIASSKAVASEVGYFTFGEPNQGIDQIVAAKLAERLNLRHQYTLPVKASEDEKKLWDRMVGDVVRATTRDFFRTLETLPYDVIFTGMYGETGRARLYRYDCDTINDQPATAKFVLSRLTLGHHPKVVASVEEWLAPIQTLPRSAVLDLAFNELRFANWGMAQAPIQRAMKMTLMPFAQRVVQNAFMRMEPTTQGTEVFFDSLVRYMWPASMDLPINKYGDYRDRLGKLAKFASRDSIIRYIRDRFA